MQISLSWESNSCSVSQEIAWIWFNLRVCCCLHISTPLIPVRKQINPIHTRNKFHHRLGLKKTLSLLSESPPAKGASVVGMVSEPRKALRVVQVMKRNWVTIVQLDLRRLDRNDPPQPQPLDTWSKAVLSQSFCLQWKESRSLVPHWWNHSRYNGQLTVKPTKVNLRR